MSQVYLDQLSNVEGWTSKVVTEYVGQRGADANQDMLLMWRKRQLENTSNAFLGNNQGTSCPQRTQSLLGAKVTKNFQKPKSEDIDTTMVITPFGSPGYDHATTPRGTSGEGHGIASQEGDYSSLEGGPEGRRNEGSENDPKKILKKGLKGSNRETSPDPVIDSTPTKPGDDITIRTLSDFPIVKTMHRQKGKVLTLGFDTEFQNTWYGTRDILSYQFSFILPGDPETLYETVFIPNSGERASLEFMVSVLVKTFGLHNLTGYIGNEYTYRGVSSQVGYYWIAHTDPNDPSVTERFNSYAEASEHSAYPLEAEALRTAYTLHKRERRPRKALTPRYDHEKLTLGDGVGWYFDPYQVAKQGLKVLLLCHYGPADLGTFRGAQTDEKFLMKYLTSAGGGLFSERPYDVVYREPTRDRRSVFYFPARVSVRDTLTYAPAGQGKLSNLGRVVGFEKLELPDGYDKSDMTTFMLERTGDFLAYGANDASICVIYSGSLWGHNVTLPATLPSAAASAIRHSVIDYLGLSSEVNEYDEKVSTTLQFAKVFTGLAPDKSRINVTYDPENGDSYHVVKKLKPIDGNAEAYNSGCTRAYRGGYNASFVTGYFPHVTYDLDLQSAYPTAMVVTPDVDYTHPGTVVDTKRAFDSGYVLTEDDFDGFTTPFVGQVRFEFPESVRFPCIPVPVLGSVIYPRTSGEHGVYASTPELLLALKLGAKITCISGHFARVLRRPDGSPSRSLGHAMVSMVQARLKAREIFGKGSLEELLFKTACNSVYGKTAQDLSEQRAWDARLQEYGPVGGSAITSPHHANMTTSLVRAVLLATLNQLDELGYESYSVTTDGLITTAPVDVVQKLDLYGLQEVFAQGRMELSGNSELWEQKHQQSDLLNHITRQNTSLEPNGVNAHGGYKVPEGIEEDSYEDRLLLRRLLTNRDLDPVENIITRFPSFKELTRDKDRKDFVTEKMKKNLRFIDVKRKPIASTLNTDMVPDPDGPDREMVHYNTEPWETPEDFERAKRVIEDMRHLGTEEAVKLFLFRFQHTSKTMRVGKMPGHTIMRAILAGHRLGLNGFEVPALNKEGGTVAQRLEWLNSWQVSERALTVNDWNNARRKERQTDTLPYDVVEPVLKVLQACPVGQAGYKLSW